MLHVKTNLSVIMQLYIDGYVPNWVPFSWL